MSVKESGLAKTTLNRVEEQMGDVIESLVALRMGDAGVEPLREAARLLEQLHCQAVHEPLAPALAPALRRIDGCARRAQELLETAAAFYRGWLCTSAPIAQDYTPEGHWVEPGGASRLLAEA